MEKWLIGLGVLIVLAAIFGQSADTPTDTIQRVDDDAPDSGGGVADPVEDEEEEPAPEPPAEPEGKFGLASCDVQLSSDLYGQNFLIGSTEVVNTGEVEATIEVSFKWLMGDGSKVKAQSKMVTMKAGRDRYVFFKVPTDVDSVSSFQDHPGYFSGENCKTDANIS